MPINCKTFILLFLALAAYGQQTSVAVLPSDGTALSPNELEALTDEMREAALKVLPTNAFVLLKQDVIVKRLGGAENFIKECKESTCIVNLGKKAQVDYVSQASVFKLGNSIRLKVELYNVRTEGMVSIINDEAENIRGLFAIVKKRVSDEVFSKIPDASGKGEDYESNFGVLEIKPASLDDIGKDEPWNLYINGKQFSSWENKLSPGKYKVELKHRCYEDITFEVSINKDSREVFDMAGNITLKNGGLILNAERGNEPVSESVFVDNKYVGETPFIGAIPLCAKVDIGKNREVINVGLKHNEKVRYTYKSSLYEPVFNGEPYAPVQEKPSITSFWVAIGLDVLGLVAISYGIYENYEVKEAHNRYSERGQSPEYYRDARKEFENRQSIRNTLYIVGGAFLASGIGMHIWF